MTYYNKKMSLFRNISVHPKLPPVPSGVVVKCIVGQGIRRGIPLVGMVRMVLQPMNTLAPALNTHIPHDSIDPVNKQLYTTKTHQPIQTRKDHIIVQGRVGHVRTIDDMLGMLDRRGTEQGGQLALNVQRIQHSYGGRQRRVRGRDVARSKVTGDLYNARQ
jgi:hypothetical protein